MHLVRGERVAEIDLLHRLDRSPLIEHGQRAAGERIDAKRNARRLVAPVYGDHVERAVERPAARRDAAVPRDDNVAVGGATPGRQSLHACNGRRDLLLDTWIEVPAVPKIPRPAVREVADPARAAG